MRIGQLRRMRLSVGMTQRQLAKRLGVAVPTVCGWESGYRTPSPRYIPQLAECFGLKATETTDLIFQSK